MVPGEDPVANLQKLIASAPAPRVVVVDQFEELFTLNVARGADGHEQFAAMLLELAAAGDRVILTMRSDKTYALGDLPELEGAWPAEGGTDSPRRGRVPPGDRGACREGGTQI